MAGIVLGIVVGLSIAWISLELVAQFAKPKNPQATKDGKGGRNES